MGKRTHQKGQKPPPIASALLMCEHGHINKEDARYTLLRTFPIFSRMNFPCFIADVAVFYVLTSGHGKTPVKIVFTDVNEKREPIFEFEDEVNFLDPNYVVQRLCAYHMIAIRHPGEYRLQLRVQDEQLLECKYFIRPIEDNPSK